MKRSVTGLAKGAFCLMVLVGISMLMPALAAADTFNFSFSNNGSGTDISNLSVGGTTVSFEMATSSLTSQLSLLASKGTLISSLFINDFQASTLVETDEFDRDIITSVNVVSVGGDRTVTDVTFVFETMQVLTPAATPEPSSLLLLGTGLLSGLGALRGKLRR